MKKITLTSLVTFLILLFSITNSYSQTSSVEEESCFGNCTAQDIKIIDVFLTDVNGDPIGTCDSGDTITVYLWVNLTSASKHNLYLQYNLLLDSVQQNSIGTKYTDKIYGAITSGAYHVSTITYTCGQLMELTDIYMSWTTPSGSEPACTDGPKCNGLTPDIMVPTPIAANYTYTACNDGTNTTVTFTNTTTGGDTGSSYNYAWDFNDDGIIDSTSQNPTYTYSNTGIPYEAELTVTQGIYSNSYEEYLVFPNQLVLSATLTQPTCDGDLGSVVLSANGGTGTYTYSGDATINLSAGNYSYIVTDEAGCTAPIDVTLNDATGPTATIIGNEELTCENVTITLNASDSTVQGTADYLWSTGEITETIDIDTPGDYTVTVTDLSNNCTDSFTVTVTQDVLQPTAIIVGGPDIIFCENSFTILDASTSVVQGTASYLWSTGETTSSIEVTTSDIYIVTVTDSDNGCSESVWVTVTAQLEPNAGDDGTITVCQGTTPSEATLFAALTGADEG
ncbi:MAG: PKD domain-containing protein, partial [Lutibacter sp.]|uniref:PKD domain-containing protein n=1 Tax=Lutibacter sp. TaxID=1925666 RepID=UPI001A014B9A